MVQKPAKTRGNSPFQSAPKPTNTTSATLRGDLLNMTPEELRDLLSELGVNIEIKEEGRDSFPDANDQQKIRFADVNLDQGVVSSNATKMSTLSSGLNLQTKSCLAMELGRARVMIAKEKFGNNLLNRQKTKKIVTTALTPAIAGSNVTKILSTTDVDLYDAAEDATQLST
jgi:hypothetical protein